MTDMTSSCIGLKHPRRRCAPMSHRPPHRSDRGGRL